jgi:hypothetical protein
MLLIKSQYTESVLGYRTLAHLRKRKVNFNNKELFIKYLVERLGILNESYQVLPISELLFTYIIKDGLATAEDQASLTHIEDKDLAWHRFNNKDLPITMDPYKFGEVKARQEIENFIRYIVLTSKNKLFQIDSSQEGLVNNVTILGGADLKWTDTAINYSIDSFKREIQKSTIYFLDGEVVLRKQVLSAKPFKSMKVDKVINESFITIDIETIKNSDNQLVPYLINAYNGIDHITSYATSEMNQKVLFDNFLTQLLTFFNKKGKLLTVYAHNLSGFDGVFLMKE